MNYQDHIHILYSDAADVMYVCFPTYGLYFILFQLWESKITNQWSMCGDLPSLYRTSYVCFRTCLMRDSRL